MIIEIRKLHINAFIGVWEWEQKERQTLFVTLKVKLTRPPKTDDLSQTLDYDALSQNLTKKIEAKRYHLIEKVAEDIVSLLAQNQKIAWAEVTVEKPNALKKAETVSVTHQQTFER